jgi:hypothetical protein
MIVKDLAFPHGCGQDQASAIGIPDLSCDLASHGAEYLRQQLSKFGPFRGNLKRGAGGCGPSPIGGDNISSFPFTHALVPSLLFSS